MFEKIQRPKTPGSSDKDEAKFSSLSAPSIKDIEAKIKEEKARRLKAEREARLQASACCACGC